MIKRTVLGVVAGVALLSGCSNAITDIKPLTMEEVAGNRLAKLSNDEKEGLIYQYVSDRIKVDKERLMTIEKDDLGRINSTLRDINSYLKGGNNKSLKEEYANYLLMEFARTPYEWKQSNVEEVGFDPAARLYFVDVTYNTTGSYKKVVPSSKIPNGSPSEDMLKKERYTDYLTYLNAKTKGGSAKGQLKEFEKAWGKVSDITAEQQGVSLVDRTRAEKSGGIGKLTYSGLIQDSNFNGGADMTVRYVFKYKYNLGEETDLEVVSLYLKDYGLQNSEEIIKGFDNKKSVGTEVLKPFIDKTVTSYHKSIEESNDTGLYNVFYDYSGVDKYYSDLTKYTYNSIGGYKFKVLQRSGTNVVIQVDRVNKVRAKGAEMSLPTYDETLIYNLVLDKDDKIKIRSANLVKSTLVGEPISVIKNVSGISDLIQYSGESFTDSNKKQVEKALKKFNTVVFNAKVDTPEFSDVVDVGVSQSTLKKMSDVITAVPDANRKVNYIVSWDTKTNVFTSVTMREVFETDGGNLDTESVVDLVNRDGEWKVVNYTRTMNVKTNSVKADTKNALSEDVR